MRLEALRQTVGANVQRHIVALPEREAVNSVRQGMKLDNVCLKKTCGTTVSRVAAELAFTRTPVNDSAAT